MRFSVNSRFVKTAFLVSKRENSGMKAFTASDSGRIINIVFGMSGTGYREEFSCRDRASGICQLRCVCLTPKIPLLEESAGRYF